MTGALLLLVTSDAVFRSIVPFLILLSCLLLAVQDPLRRWVASHRAGDELRAAELTGIFLAGTYGGYFGAGLGIMLIAVLGLFSSVAFTQLNAVKQPLAAAINLSAAAFLVFSGLVEWTLVAVMAPAALVGGALGGPPVDRAPGATVPLDRGGRSGS